MARNQIGIWFPAKHEEKIKEFKMAVLDVHGQIYGNLADEIIQAMEHWRELILHHPEKIGRERNSKRSVTAMEKEVIGFLSIYGDALKNAETVGIKEENLKNMIFKYFKCESEKTIRSKRDMILRYKQWSILKFPGVRPRIIMSRLSNLYVEVKKFDIANSQKGIKATVGEIELIKQLKKRVLEIWKWN